MQKIQLNPCPFCGSNEIVFSNQITGDFINCKGCGVYVAIDRTGLKPGEDLLLKLIERWNVRVDSDSELEHLRKDFNSLKSVVDDIVNRKKCYVNNEKRTHHRWTVEQIVFVLDKYYQDHTYQQVADLFNKKYNVDITTGALSGVVSRAYNQEKLRTKTEKDLYSVAFEMHCKNMNRKDG